MIWHVSILALLIKYFIEAILMILVCDNIINNTGMLLMSDISSPNLGLRSYHFKHTNTL
jgi:hypothetical protein